VLPAINPEAAMLVVPQANEYIVEPQLPDSNSRPGLAMLLPTLLMVIVALAEGATKVYHRS